MSTDFFWKSPAIHKAIAFVSCGLMTACFGGLVHAVTSINDLKTQQAVNTNNIHSIKDDLRDIKNIVEKIRDKLP